MPESKVRNKAAVKKNAKDQAELNEKRQERTRLAPASRNWVPAVFLPVGLLGVVWMVVNSLAGQSIGFMQILGDWNIGIGLGLIVACFAGMTLWK